MQTLLCKYWNQLVKKRSQLKWCRLVEKHRLIARQGISVSATAMRIDIGKDCNGNHRLMRIQLCIEFLDDTKALVIAKCLVKKDLSFLEGRRIQFKFLPGDLSQIVLQH